MVGNDAYRLAAAFKEGAHSGVQLFDSQRHLEDCGDRLLQQSSGVPPTAGWWGVEVLMQSYKGCEVLRADRRRVFVVRC
jgi:hypothetical protein